MPIFLEYMCWWFNPASMDFVKGGLSLSIFWCLDLLKQSSTGFGAVPYWVVRICIISRSKAVLAWKIMLETIKYMIRHAYPLHALRRRSSNNYISMRCLLVLPSHAWNWLSLYTCRQTPLSLGEEFPSLGCFLGLPFLSAWFLVHYAYSFGSFSRRHHPNHHNNPLVFIALLCLSGEHIAPPNEWGFMRTYW